MRLLVSAEPDADFVAGDALAFQNLDGSVITEVYDNGASALTTTVAASGALYRFDVPAHGGLPFSPLRDGGSC